MKFHFPTDSPHKDIDSKQAGLNFLEKLTLLSDFCLIWKVYLGHPPHRVFFRYHS